MSAIALSMEPQWTHQPEINLRQPFGWAARVTFGFIGVAVIFLVLSDLGRALWPFGWWSVFFAIIVGTACALGLTLIYASLMGDSLSWTLHGNHVLLERDGPWRKSRERFGGPDVTGTFLRTHTWDSGPDTYSVVITLKNGRLVEAPPLASLQRAKDLEAELRARLRIA